MMDTIRPLPVISTVQVVHKLCQLPATSVAGSWQAKKGSQLPLSLVREPFYLTIINNIWWRCWSWIKVASAGRRCSASQMQSASSRGRRASRRQNQVWSGRSDAWCSTFCWGQRRDADAVWRRSCSLEQLYFCVSMTMHWEAWAIVFSGS